MATPSANVNRDVLATHARVIETVLYSLWPLQARHVRSVVVLMQHDSRAVSVGERTETDRMFSGGPRLHKRS